MYIVTVGSTDKDNGTLTTPNGMFQHYGPGIDINGASTANTVRSTFKNSKGNVVEDCWIYDLNTDFGNGTIENYVSGLSGSLNVVNRSDIPPVDENAVGIAYTQVPSDF